MPFAEYHYPFDQKEVFESRFPAQFIAEYIAQTRAWFYVMHVIGFNLFGHSPFENVVTTGTILAEDGSKMSKSKKNYTDPMEIIDKYEKAKKLGVKIITEKEFSRLIKTK
jgi:isoleucyl-tRNA synthetase